MEFPRHVYRFVAGGGLESKIVTATEWPDAEADGWILDPNAPAPDADLASALTADLERQDARKETPHEAGDDAASGDMDAEPSGKPHKGGKKK